MKTKLILLQMLMVGLLLSSCTSEKPSPTYKENFEAFARGEKGFFETFNFGIGEGKVVKGRIVSIEPILVTSQWFSPRESGMILTLDNGEKVETKTGLVDKKTYKDLKEMNESGEYPYIEARVAEGKPCKYIVLYDKKKFDEAIDFYKNGEKRKDLGKSTLNLEDYPLNRYYGKAQNSKKSRVYASILFYFNSNPIVAIYLENGEVLCLSNVLAYYLMKKNNYPEDRQILNYVSSNLDGYCNYNNVYDYEIE